MKLIFPFIMNRKIKVVIIGTEYERRWSLNPGTYDMRVDPDGLHFSLEDTYVKVGRGLFRKYGTKGTCEMSYFFVELGSKCPVGEGEIWLFHRDIDIVDKYIKSALKANSGSSVKKYNNNQLNQVLPSFPSNVSTEQKKKKGSSWVPKIFQKSERKIKLSSQSSTSSTNTFYNQYEGNEDHYNTVEYEDAELPLQSDKLFEPLRKSPLMDNSQENTEGDVYYEEEEEEGHKYYNEEAEQSRPWFEKRTATVEYFDEVEVDLELKKAGEVLVNKKDIYAIPAKESE